VFVKADISDKEAIVNVFEKYRPVYVVNFAAETHVDRSIDDPSAFLHTNVMGAFVLLEAARSLYEKLEGEDRTKFRFLHVSTDEVYGSLPEKGLFEEDTTYAPNSPYAASKAGADHLVRAYHKTYGLPTFVTNCSNNYGPRQFPEKLIPLMILNALEGKPLPIYGDGKNVRDWLYVEDHCSGIWTVLSKGEVGEKYNMGGNCEMTNVGVLDLICEILEEIHPAGKNRALSNKGLKNYGELKTFVPDRPGHDRRYAMDFSKIEKTLGWRPKHDFRGGLAKTIRWYLNNLSWCEAVQAGNYGRERLGLK